mmetsp:Transcript_25226/g.55005  ORF Transcript_25226/g.55005 Transcript_25226/m.55005 type:complete len:91 (+) Transcript_25226:658-930(+)
MMCGLRCRTYAAAGTAARIGVARTERRHEPNVYIESHPQAAGLYSKFKLIHHISFVSMKCGAETAPEPSVLLVLVQVHWAEQKRYLQDMR